MWIQPRIVIVPDVAVVYDDPFIKDDQLAMFQRTQLYFSKLAVDQMTSSMSGLVSFINTPVQAYVDGLRSTYNAWVYLKSQTDYNVQNYVNTFAVDDNFLR